jgi:hypothetical protein
MAVASVQKPGAPTVSRGTVELLLDLVEIKLGCVEVHDREDRRELRALERARAELTALLGRSAPGAAGPRPRPSAPARFAA